MWGDFVLGKIVYMSNNIAHVQIPPNIAISTNLMNIHVIFEDDTKKEIY